MRPPVPVALTALVLTAILAGCATRSEDTVSEIEPASTGAPQSAEGLDWFLHQDATEARLVYGVAESDDMRLALDCSKGSGQIALVALAATGAPAEIHLESGGDTERFRAEVEEDPLHDGLMLTTQAAVTEPVLQRFRQVGWIARWRDDQREVMVPHTEAQPDIERFFAFCAG